jgi:hypothetical protein
MVISFSVGEARKQLLEKGEVYTFRFKRRKRIGKDWANSGRGTKKITDVFIEEIGEYNPTAELKPYVQKSGFKNLWDWQDAIIELSEINHAAIREGWLYRVMVVDEH